MLPEKTNFALLSRSNEHEFQSKERPLYNILKHEVLPRVIIVHSAQRGKKATLSITVCPHSVNTSPSPALLHSFSFVSDIIQYMGLSRAWHWMCIKEGSRDPS